MYLKTILGCMVAASCTIAVTGVITNCSQPVRFSAAPQKKPVRYTNVEQKFIFGPQKAPAVDILIVDDNSGSMQDDQQNLAAGFSDFISDLSGVDWQIAVTTTDVCADKDNDCRGWDNPFPPARGRLVGPADEAETKPFGTQYIMRPSTPNVAAVFAQTIQRTTSSGHYLNGSGDERAIDAANLTIDGSQNANVAKGFFRQNAGLAIVILSNEDERSCGNDPACHDDPNNTPQYKPFTRDDYPSSLIANIRSTFGATKNFSVSSLIVEPGHTLCYNIELANGGDFGDTYADLTKMTGGILASICDTGTGQYAQDLSAISQSIRNTAKTVIQLRHVPVERPQVTFIPAADITFTWRPGSSQITLSAYPANRRVIAKYKY